MTDREKYIETLRKYYDAIENAIFFMNIVETEMKLDFSQERLLYIRELNSVKQKLSYYGILFKSRRNYQHPEWTWKEWKESFMNSRFHEPRERMSEEEKRAKKHEYYLKNKDKWNKHREKKKKHE